MKVLFFSKCWSSTQRNSSRAILYISGIKSKRSAIGSKSSVSVSKKFYVIQFHVNFDWWFRQKFLTVNCSSPTTPKTRLCFFSWIFFVSDRHHTQHMCGDENLECSKCWKCIKVRWMCCVPWNFKLQTRRRHLSDWFCVLYVRNLSSSPNQLDRFFTILHHFRVEVLGQVGLIEQVLRLFLAFFLLFNILFDAPLGKISRKKQKFDEITHDRWNDNCFAIKKRRLKFCVLTSTHCYDNW